MLRLMHFVLTNDQPKSEKAIGELMTIIVMKYCLCVVQYKK